MHSNRSKRAGHWMCARDPRSPPSYCQPAFWRDPAGKKPLSTTPAQESTAATQGAPKQHQENWLRKKTIGRRTSTTTGSPVYQRFGDGSGPFLTQSYPQISQTRQQNRKASTPPLRLEETPIPSAISAASATQSREDAHIPTHAYILLSLVFLCFSASPR
jgi:hypothetical protein